MNQTISSHTQEDLIFTCEVCCKQVYPELVIDSIQERTTHWEIKSFRGCCSPECAKLEYARETARMNTLYT